MQKIFDIVRRLWRVPFLRFLVVGGFTTILFYAVFAIFLLLHFHYALAALIAISFSILFNFKTYGILVFQNKNNRLFFRFFGVAILLYFLDVGLLKIFDIYNFNKLAAQAILTVPVTAVSYTMYRNFVFRTVDKKQTG